MPEIAVRSMLHNAGYRFRLHSKSLPGKPDIVLAKYKTVIFVHGCFWHRHKGCKYAYSPKSRKTFWRSKFTQNIERHKIVARELISLGWQVVVVWACEIKNSAKLLSRLKNRLKSSGTCG